MSFSRMPFEEAQKCLTVSSIPKSLLRDLALHLDKFCESNWEYLAEKLEIAPEEIEWVKNTVINCQSGSPTFRLFDKFLLSRDILLEKFLRALETIKNFAAARTLTEGYKNGAFDASLKQLNSNGYKVNTNSLKDTQQCHASKLDCISFEQHYHSSPTFPHSGYLRGCPGYSHHGVERENFQKVPSSNGSFSSGSTYDSLDGQVGDSISYTRCDSDYSTGTNHSSYEQGIPMAEAMYRTENQLPSVTGYPIQRSVFENGNFRIADDVLDLSKISVKAEPRCCHDGVKRDQKPNGNCNGVCRQQRPRKEGETRCCERCGQNPMPFSRENHAHHPLKQEIVKNEPLDAEENFPKPEKDLCKENMLAKGDLSCCCLSNSKFCHKNGISKVDPGGPVIYLRDPTVQCAQGKRITHPLLKEDLEEEEMKKNPDGTTPVRTTGSSYGVVQQSPFKKDSRSIRVFLTYSEDSKKHMKRVMQLCECLKKNNFSVSLDIRETKLLSQDRIGWYDKRFKVADYILVLISPKYFSDVTEPDKSKKADEDDLALNTLYIHRCMQAEYMDNNCLNKRFIPVLMPGASKSHIPVWLHNTTKYVWPEQYKNLFFYMMYPAHVIAEFVTRERSARMPIVQQTNH